MSSLDPHRQAIKDDFIKNRGYWMDIWEEMLRLNPDFFKAYTDFSSAPWKHGTLEPKVKEFMYIAADASTTHLYNRGTRVHIQNALRHGASEEEVFEVLAMTSVLGIHSCSLGMPVLIEELQAAGKLNRPKFDERRQKIKDEYIKVRGYWSERQEDMLAMAPEFFEAYLNFSGAPWRTNVLEPKVREFVYIAIDASTTHLYEPGLRLHIRNAIGYGASQEELMEILQLIAALGIHTMTESLPILTQEAAKAKNKKG